MSVGGGLGVSFVCTENSPCSTVTGSLLDTKTAEHSSLETNPTALYMVSGEGWMIESSVCGLKKSEHL